MADESGGDYEVGYKKPPRHTQFKKGQSGNPAGRPKGAPNLATVLERTLRERVVINENGRRRPVSKLEAAVKQLVNKAAIGDAAALRQLLALVQLTEERAAATGEPAVPTDAADAEVLRIIQQRVAAAIPGDQHEADAT